MTSELLPLRDVGGNADVTTEELTGQLNTNVAIFTELLRLIDERDKAAKI